MSSKFKEIIQGWRNTFIPPKEAKEFIHKVSEERLSICKTCPNNTTPGKIKFYSRCSECGCPLIQKSNSLISKCPIGLWDAVASEEEQHKINLAVNDSSQSADMENDNDSPSNA